MTWSKSQKRWLKKYRGKMYSVSPRQLGVAANKEASRAAANDWWTAKQKEVDDTLGKAKQHPVALVKHYQDAIEKHALYAKWQRRFGNSVSAADAAEKKVEFLRHLLTTPDPVFPLPDTLYDPLEEARRDVPFDDKPMFDLLWFDRFCTIEREERDKTAVPKERTIRAFVDAYLTIRKAQAEAQGKRQTYYYSTNPWTQVFRGWVDPYSPIEAIDEQLWERYFVYLSGKVSSGDYSPATFKNYQGAARAFIRWCWTSGHIDSLPRNLASKNLTVRIPLTEPVLFTPQEIKSLLAAANDRQ
jgi:hypothetical protein